MNDPKKENPDSLTCEHEILAFISKVKDRDGSGYTTKLFFEELSLDFAFMLWRRVPDSSICLVVDGDGNVFHALEQNKKYYCIKGRILPINVKTKINTGVMF